MARFDLSPDYCADCVIGDKFRAGDIDHVVRHATGGGNMTPVARYFVWRPNWVEGFNPHWHVDCYVRRHPLAPSDPMVLGRALVAALIREKLCEEPIWMSSHRTDEVDGEDYGDLFEEQ